MGARKRKQIFDFVPHVTLAGALFVAAVWGIFSLLDTQPDFQASHSTLVRSSQKISDTDGNFTAVLDDGDNFGVGVADIGDLDGDGVTDLAASAWFDDDGAADNGALYILFMNTDGTVKDHQKISETEGGFGGDFQVGDLGTSITPIGDLDGDGVTDLAVGERARDDGGFNRGGYWILFMNTDGTVKAEQAVSDTEGNFTATLDDSDLFGNHIEPVGDVDGDGVVDLVVSATRDDDGGADVGAMYIIHQNTNGTVKSHSKIFPGDGFPVAFAAPTAWGTALTVVSDMDGDGVDDWITTDPLDDDGASNAGALYVLFMNSDETIKSFQKISATEGGFSGAIGAEDRFGSAIDNIGDLDGNGIDDIIVGAWQDDDGGMNRGSFYLLLLNADGTVKDWHKVSDTEGGFTGELDDGDFFGFQIAVVDDLDGNGTKDVIAGALSDDDGGTNLGAAYVLFLNALPGTGGGGGQADEFLVPTNTSFTINDGAECTPTRNVELQLYAENTREVVVGHDPYFIGFDWEPYVTPPPMIKQWQLPLEDGIHPVYVLYRSEDRNQSNLLSQTIRLDQENQCNGEELPACKQNCNLLRFQFYLRNPDGTEIASDSTNVRINWTNGIGEIYYFEDKDDYDFNDVIAYADRAKCNEWRFQVLEINAKLHHDVGVRAYYDNQLIEDIPLSDDSHDMIGVTYTFNGQNFLPECPVQAE